MAVDIGPKIGIDGEAEFRKEINNITQQIKTFGSEMKILTADMDKNEDSVESLNDKNAILTKTIDAQAKKLELLKKGLADSARELGENDTKTLKWQQAVNQATADLKKMEAEVSRNENTIENLKNGIDETSDALEEAGNEATGFGDILKGSLAADAIVGTISAIKDSVVGFGQEIAEYSRESENATKKATAYFGETGEAAEQTEKIIKDVFTGGVGESLDQVSDAVIAVKQNLKDLSETDMKNLTDQAITLENTYGIDMNETLRGVNALMEQFGLDVQTAMDYVVAGTQNGLDKTQELGDNLSEYAGKFSQAGYSAQEYFQLLNNGLDGGAYNLDKVNDAINEVTTRLADGTIADAIGSYSDETQRLFEAWQNGEATQKQVIDSIVNDISRAEGQQEALNLAATAFGTMAEDGNLKFIESLTSVGNTYDDVSGKAQGMFDATTTSQQELDSAFRTAKEQLDPIGDKLNEIAVDVIPKATNAFLDFTEFVNTNGPLIAASIAGIGTAFIAWNIGSIISGVTGALSSMKMAVLGVNAAIAANPIGALITLILAIVTAIVTFIATNEDAKQSLLGVWDTIKGAISSAIETIKSILNSIIEFVKSNWQALLLMLVNPFAGAFKLLYDNCEGFRNVVDNMVEAVKTAFTNLWQNVSQRAAEIGQSIINGIQSAVTFISELPGKFLTWGKDMIDNMIAGIKSGISAVGDAVRSVADKISSFLHFSEPDEGPLSNFHTFMPDMTDLMVKGIRAGIPKVESAINDMAEVMVPQTSNGTAAAYDRMAAQMSDMQVVLEDGTLVGKLAPRINSTLGGYKRMQGRFGV